ncbi:MAG: leucyl aminopeptidase, partial [Actinomycetes bacterium]
VSMTSITFKIAASAPKTKTPVFLVLAVQADDSAPKLLGPAAKSPVFKALDLRALNFSGTAESSTRTNTSAGVVGFIGTGKGINSTLEARNIGGAIGRAFKDQKSITVDIPLNTTEELVALIEGISFVQYEFTKYKSFVAHPMQLTSVTVISQFKVSAIQLKRIRILTEALDATRDLVNTPANDLFPAKLAQIISAHAKLPNVKVEVWDESRLAKEKCHGILAVGQGSVRSPRLVKIVYTPPNAKAHLALVGKGITFDTGGISLKPKTGILGMKYDMAGAATVGEATIAIARLGLPVKVTTFLCIAENMPSGSATRPDDVVTFKNGKTIEITNTDAEGRLVLADGLILASELKPDLIIDLATLTGAASIALGNRYTGLMGEDDSVAAVQSAARNAGELVWHMPLPAELLELLKSDIADMMNSRVGNPTGSMLVGGLFLREFVGSKSAKDKTRLNWAHLDFATGANNDLAPYGSTVKGATGSMIRTLVALAEQLGTKAKK